MAACLACSKAALTVDCLVACLVVLTVDCLVACLAASLAMSSVESWASTTAEHLDRLMAASKEHLKVASSGESLAVMKERWRAVPMAHHSVDLTVGSKAALTDENLAACLVYHLVESKESMSADSKECQTVES